MEKPGNTTRNRRHSNRLVKNINSIQPRPERPPIKPTDPFLTPDSQPEKLTELYDDNSSYTPITGNVTTKPIPTKIGQGSTKGTVDMFDASPNNQYNPIKLNFAGKNSSATKPNKDHPKLKLIQDNVYHMVYDSGDTTQQTQAKSSVGRPNLRVLNCMAPTTPQEKEKTLVEVKINESPKLEKTEVVKPIIQTNTSSTESKPVTMDKPVTEAPKPVQQKPAQSSGFKGRMTAASFMKPQMYGNVHKDFIPNYPKGIPKSFLATPGHIAIVRVKGENFVLQWDGKGTPINEKRDANPFVKLFRHSPSWNSMDSERFDEDITDAGPSGQAFGQIGQELPQVKELSQIKQVIGQNTQVSDHSGNSTQQKQKDEMIQQVYVQIDNDGAEQHLQQYSPSDAYADNSLNEGNEEASNHSKSPESGSKRLSAFKRLGPLTQPKKPKLTINLLCNKDQSVREVVDQSEEEESKYTPVHLRADIQTSTDETVMKYLIFWPWKKNMPQARRIITARLSKSVMLLELEQMEEYYEKDSAFFQISVTGYPPSWTKENVLDALLESLKGKSFIPCFIDFLKDECRFLVIRNRAALNAIHKFGFIIHKDDVTLHIAIYQIILTTTQLEFIPRLVLRKRLMLAVENECELNLSEFTTKSDISHFIYFPLNRISNQSELIHLQSSVPWQHLTKLNLSHNRMTTLSGLNLQNVTTKLKHLDVSYNYLESLSPFVQLRQLPLISIVLEGNPLCTDFTEKESYIKALKMLFSSLREVDGIKLTLRGDFPPYIKNYCPPEAQNIVEKLLEVMFPLLDSLPDERSRIENMYDVNAVMTITYMYKLRYGPIFKDYRALFSRVRLLEEGDMDTIEGADTIAKLIYKWPILCHDPTTFNVDVLYHTNTTTIIRISGIMKLTAVSLAEDEHLLSFSRTLVLSTIDSVEYKITNEMIYWGLPDREMARKAFQVTTVRSKNLNLKFETPPDEDLKAQLVEIFMKLTELDRKPSERCLEMKDWHLRNALEYFSKLLKIDNIEPLFNS